MSPSQRARHMDVTNTIDVTDPMAVLAALQSILAARYPGFDFSAVDTLMRDFSRLYRGEFPGYRASDTAYHNLQHVLDVSLAMARLLDGHDGACAADEVLGPEMALAGIAAALFHDAGYIRRREDNSCTNGAAYTRVHVSRSEEFMSEYFPTVGLAHLLPSCKRIVHFTGYEVDPGSIDTRSSREYALGSLLGSADLIAQIADVDYLKKCQENLYAEFVLAGMAGEGELEGYKEIVYRSPRQLMESTPDFIRTVIDARLEGYFNGVYHYAAKHFNGPNLYMDAIEHNRRALQRLLASTSD
ncbi:MAG: hypothetical protein IMF06_01375 [Proteobacteria bacterium]|nr:hypothetical protein [Pseudomonadota bacterium]